MDVPEDVSPGFRAWGDARRAKLVITRHAKSQDRAAEAKALYAGGKTQQQIAAILGMKERQVRTLLKS
jgi:DNA-binding CsgD family transcriptional regulator